MENSEKIIDAKSSVVVPRDMPFFNKSVKEEKTSSSRSFAFETRRQRNKRMIEKGLSKPGQISFDTLRRSANSVHVIRICITVLKEKITKTKWIIKSRDPLIDVEQSKIEKVEELFKHPNRNDETFRTLLDKMLEDLLVLDSVSLEKTRYADGTLAELHFIDSATIRPVFDEHGNQDVKIPLNTKDKGTTTLPVSYVQVLDNSNYGGPESGEIVAAWPKRDFIHFHMHPQGSMENFGYGLAPIEGIIGVVSNLLNADNFNSTYFEEGGFPPAIINIAGQMTQEDLEATREYIYSEMMGSFHRPAIMAGAEGVTVTNLKDLTNRDMQFMEYTLFLSRLAAAAYGLSGQDIGLVDDLNRATSQTQVGLSEEKGYGSILHLIKEVFNQEIIWKDFGYTDLEFDWVVDDRTDPQITSTICDTALKNGTMTINEVREKQGLMPFDEWADMPRLLNSSGEYIPMTAAEKEQTEDKDMIGGENAYNEQDLKKSIYTADGYKTWVDDRGYGQPFISVEVITGKGWVVKPPVAVNLMSADLECEISQELIGRKLNVPLVQKMSYQDVTTRVLQSDIVRGEFEKYCYMTPEYDSEKWRARQGGSRKFPAYLVSAFIDGYPLDSKIVLADMARDPKSYTQAIKDLAALWLAEKELVLGDRRANQYMITHDKRAFGFDYQFKGNATRWKDSSNAIHKVLLDIPELYELFHKEIDIKPKFELVKSIANVFKKASNISPNTAVDLAADIKNNPVLFSEMINDEFIRAEIKNIFKLQDINILTRCQYREIGFNYDYNQALRSLKEFVDKNPRSYGGIVTSEDVRGLKYSIFVKS
jgi:phage portal protein BeeE